MSPYAVNAATGGTEGGDGIKSEHHSINVNFKVLAETVGTDNRGGAIIANVRNSAVIIVVITLLFIFPSSFHFGYF